MLKKKGWLGEKTIRRPDGSTKEVDLSQPWRLKTIYQTNMQTVYMAGRYKGMMDVVETRPYWRYVAVIDGRTRDEQKVEEIVAKANRLREIEESRVLPELPRADEAVIPTSKLTSYALDEIKQSDKARAFREALGYTKANAQELLDNIKRNLPYFPAQKRGNNGYGERYEVIMTLKGPNEKTVKVLTGWIDDIETGEMRLTTIHIDL